MQKIRAANLLLQKSAPGWSHHSLRAQNSFRTAPLVIIRSCQPWDVVLLWSTETTVPCPDLVVLLSLHEFLFILQRRTKMPPLYFSYMKPLWFPYLPWGPHSYLALHVSDAHILYYFMLLFICVSNPATRLFLAWGWGGNKEQVKKNRLENLRSVWIFKFPDLSQS